MNPNPPGRSSTWSILGLGALGIVPAVLLAAFGFHALRRERGLVLHEAREAAGEQAARAAVSLQRALFHPPLPSRADVEAFEAAPGASDQEPLVRVAAIVGETPAVLCLSDRTYPSLEPTPPRPLNVGVDRGPPGFASAWHTAAFTHPVTDPSGAIRIWSELLERSAGAPWESAIRFRVAQSLLSLGRTDEARPQFEAVASAGLGLAGQTGLPLDVLALRALLQLADADPRASTARAAWMNAYCQRVLLRWRLPEALLEEWSPSSPGILREWRALAGRHAEVRRAFPTNLPELATRSGAVPPPRWVEAPGEPTRLLSTHEVAGGHWLLLRSPERLRAVVDATLAAESIPRHLRAVVRVAGRELNPAEPAAAELAQVSIPTVGDAVLTVGLQLIEPQLLHARQRVRTYLFGAFLAIASGLAVAAVVLALRALQRQRLYAEMQADFAASVSHELRAPLAAVRLLTEEVADLPPEEVERRTAYHGLLLRETRRLGLLIENVLRHARLERGSAALDREPRDLRELVTSSLDTVRPAAIERDVHIRTHLPAQAVQGHFDAQALHQVFVNLLDNALKHSADGETIEVGLESTQFPMDSRRSSGARVWVADHGPGIPGSDHRRIFQSFYRRGTELRRETAGVGLGLAIVKRLVEAHGGAVTVQSRKGTGARFTVDLPLAASAAPTDVVLPHVD